VIKKSDFKIFQKWNKEVVDALAKIERGRGEYKKGKTAAASSPSKFR